MCSWLVTFGPQISSPHLGPNVTVSMVSFLEIYYSELFEKLFHLSVSVISFLSQGLKTVEIIQIY